MNKGKYGNQVTRGINPKRTRDPGNQEILSKKGKIQRFQPRGSVTKHTTSNIIADKPYAIMGVKSHSAAS